MRKPEHRAEIAQCGHNHSRILDRAAFGKCIKPQLMLYGIAHGLCGTRGLQDELGRSIAVVFIDVKRKDQVAFFAGEYRKFTRRHPEKDRICGAAAIGHPQANMTAVRKRGHIGERNLLKQECRYGILQAERLQQAQFLGGLKIKLLKMRAAVRFNGRRTFNGVKHFSDVIAETLSKRIQLSALDRQAGGKFMAAVFDQQVAAMRKRTFRLRPLMRRGAFATSPSKEKRMEGRLYFSVIFEATIPMTP